MHDTSYILMQRFFRKYLDPSADLRLLDVGAKRYHGQPSYHDLVTSESWEYVGMDMEAGENVDVVNEDPFRWPFEDGEFDVVISGQCLEHTSDLHAGIRELARVLKPGGITCVIAPWTWPIHGYPHDYWRILPDGMRFLLSDVAGLEVLKVAHGQYRPNVTDRGDCVGIARKPLG